MKKVLTLLTFFVIFALSTFADEQKKVILSEDHTEEQLSLSFCNIFVEMTSSDGEENAKISVKIENRDDSNTILIFDRAYTEKDLKKKSPSIIFDKNFPGTKGNHEIETYKALHNVMILSPEGKKQLPDMQIRNAEVLKCRLPLYIATPKKKKFLGIEFGKERMLLTEKTTIELEVAVKWKPDEDFLRLERECNALVKEISKQSFCNNPKHNPSLQKQEAPYKEKIDSLKTVINGIIGKWFSTDKRSKKYYVLKQQLEDIDLTSYEQDCGKHKKGGGGDPIPSCKYCALSPQQIFHKLDDYYKQIYSSNNRKGTKESVMEDVNLLYTCRRHSSLWRRSEYNSRITDRYNRIINF